MSEETDNHSGALHRRVIRAGSWSFALLVGETLVGLLRLLILARLLAPEEFGLFGIALLALLALDAFSRTGFLPALVQRSGDIEPCLDTAWSVHALRGVALALVLLPAAPWVAGFFDAPSATPLIRAIGLCLALQGLSNIAVISFQRDLEFHKEFFYRFSATGTELIVAVTLGLLLSNAWALVGGLTANHGVRMVVSYLIHPYRPRFRLDGSVIRELYRYGRWVALTGILVFLSARGAGAVVGKIVGVTALGLFQMADRVAQTAFNDFMIAVNSVAFPTYASLQHDPERMTQVYLKMSGVCFAVILPVGLGILVLGRDFTLVFLGAKWLPMVPPLFLLTAAGMLNAVRTTARPVFMGLGRPRVVFHMQCARVAVLALTVVPLTLAWGITGGAAAVLLGRIGGFTVFSRNLKRVLPTGLAGLGKVMLLPALAALAMAGSLLLLREAPLFASFGKGLPAMIRFTALAGIGGIVYVTLLSLGLKVMPGEHPLKGAFILLVPVRSFGRKKDAG